VIYENGVVDWREYDARLRQVRARADGPQGPLRDLELRFDASSQVVEIVDGRPGVAPPFDLGARFEYDDHGHLVRATDAEATTEWTVDDASRVLAVRSGHPAPHLNVVNLHGEEGAGPDQLTSFGGERLRYDPAGRLLEDGSRALAWDARGRLRRVETAAGVTEYVYAHDGSRALKRETVGGKTATTR
jgi:YD repeat-containing protein